MTARCLATAFALAGCLVSPALAQAPAAPPAITRTLLQQAELEGDRHGTTLARVMIAAGGGVPRHIHAGVEIGYVLEGSGTLLVDGKAPLALKAGDSFQVAEGLVHSLTNGPAPMTLVVVYVTDKGKPLSTPAP